MSNLTRASVWHSIQASTEIAAPTIAKGVIIRRPKMVALVERFGLDDRAVRRIPELRATYGEGSLLLKTPGRPRILLIAANDVKRVLDETPEPFAARTDEKQAALAHFEPKVALIPHGANRNERTAFALRKDRQRFSRFARLPRPFAQPSFALCDDHAALIPVSTEHTPLPSVTHQRTQCVQLQKDCLQLPEENQNMPDKPLPPRESSVEGQVRIANLTLRRGRGGELHQVADSSMPAKTMVFGVSISDDQNTFKIGERKLVLLENFHFREKLFHFDHERILGRVVHARGYGAHVISRPSNPSSTSPEWIFSNVLENALRPASLIASKVCQPVPEPPLLGARGHAGVTETDYCRS